MSDQQSAVGEQPLSEAEVRAFVQQLGTFRTTLSARHRQLLDSLVMAAAGGDGEVQGYDGNAVWIFPPGWVDDAAWVRLSRECRVRGGIEEVLDPGAYGARVWGCRAP